MKKRVFVFSCIENRATQGFTLQKEGLNLPINTFCTEWEFNKEIEASLYADLIGVNQKHMLEAIEKNGYYIKYPVGKF